jgi:hypothetical protein
MLSNLNWKLREVVWQVRFESKGDVNWKVLDHLTKQKLRFIGQKELFKNLQRSYIIHKMRK